jgi:hypothetical protein
MTFFISMINNTFNRLIIYKNFTYFHFNEKKDNINLKITSTVSNSKSLANNKLRVA